MDSRVDVTVIVEMNASEAVKLTDALCSAEEITDEMHALAETLEAALATIPPVTPA